ncbi:MAG: lipid-A-disaccharide synthase, partial [Gammaproteobacteria bacterium]
GEVVRIGGPMLGAARWLVRRRPGLRFVAPMANASVRAAFEAQLGVCAGLPVHLTEGEAQSAMAAADVVLTASGTATLEAMLVGRPMVITYRTNWLTAAIARRMLRIRHAGLPNLLAGSELCPELLQERARPELLGAAVLGLLQRPHERSALRARFASIAAHLRRDADRRAAAGVLRVLDEARQ